MSMGINEIFYTIQGEARFTGTPSVFIRTQGCDVGCPWCDTKHTWSFCPPTTHYVPLRHMDEAKAKFKNDRGILSEELYTIATPREIADYVATRWPHARHVVITGGEPLAQEALPELIRALAEEGRSVQIETSGTYPLTDIPTCVWVTLSPKWDMPGGRRVLPASFERCNEIKVPIGRARDVTELLDRLADMNIDPANVWLQPLSQSRKATDLCVKSCLEYGFKLSLQMHKYAHIP